MGMEVPNSVTRDSGCYITPTTEDVIALSIIWWNIFVFLAEDFYFVLIWRSTCRLRLIVQNQGEKWHQLRTIMEWEFGKKGLPKEMLNDALLLDSDPSIFDHQVFFHKYFNQMLLSLNKWKDLRGRHHVIRVHCYESNFWVLFNLLKGWGMCSSSSHGAILG